MNIPLHLTIKVFIGLWSGDCTDHWSKVKQFPGTILRQWHIFLQKNFLLKKTELDRMVSSNVRYIYGSNNMMKVSNTVFLFSLNLQFGSFQYQVVIAQKMYLALSYSTTNTWSQALDIFTLVNGSVVDWLVEGQNKHCLVCLPWLNCVCIYIYIPHSHTDWDSV